MSMERFPKCRRLRKRREFVAVQSGGERIHARHFLLLVKRDPKSCGRVGVTVSKRVGGAVTRNRVKRWVRECLRRHETGAPSGVDLVVVAKRSAVGCPHAEVAADLRHALGRIAS